MEAPSAHQTAMFAEASQAARAVAAQEAQAGALARVGAVLRARSPHLVITCARGSSDHAATFAKYAIETRLGIPTASAAPSVASIYSVELQATGAVCIAISQSGQSPDLLATVASLKAAGAWVLALVNDAGSPLASLADEVFDLAAGKERSVAATKSFIASLSAIARVVAEWDEDDELRTSLSTLPALLGEAWELDWSALTDALGECSDLYVLGRGVGLGVAQEAALKLKETSQIHAEAFSTAELAHGPMALVKPGFPVLMFSQGGEMSESFEQSVAKLVERQARLFLAGSRAPGTLQLPTVQSSPFIEPILQVQSFYRAANALAVARGLDPDRPPHLAKVTETL